MLNPTTPASYATVSIAPQIFIELLDLAVELEANPLVVDFSIGSIL